MEIIKPQITPLTEINGKRIIQHIERIARTCYKSQDKITEDGESAKKILKILNDAHHESMMEHYSITMNYISNIAAYKDLTRHRPASYAIESTRYCNYSKDKFNNNIKFLDPVEIPDKNSAEYKLWLDTMKKIEDAYIAFAKIGAKPDQLSLLLPHSTAAEFNITANLREWKHIFSLRAAGHARPCIKEIMIPTLELFHKEIPIIFDDIYTIVQREKQRKR